MIVEYQAQRGGNGVLLTRHAIRAFVNGDKVAEAQLAEPLTEPLDQLLATFQVPALLPNVQWVQGPVKKLQLELEWQFRTDDMWVGLLWDNDVRVPVRVTRQRHLLFQQHPKLPKAVPSLADDQGYEVEVSPSVSHNDLQLERALALELVQRVHKMDADQTLQPGRKESIICDNVFSAKKLGWALNVPMLRGRGMQLRLPA